MFLDIKKSTGFAIIELLIIIVVIGALVAFASNYYSGTFKKDNDNTGDKTQNIPVGGVKNEAIDLSLRNDLTNAATQLNIYKAVNSSYPVANDCSASPAFNTICLRISSGNTIEYLLINTENVQSYELVATNTNGMKYRMVSGSGPVLSK